jgi:hypothetical protein
MPAGDNIIGEFIADVGTYTFRIEKIKNNDWYQLVT